MINLKPKLNSHFITLLIVCGVNCNTSINDGEKRNNEVSIAKEDTIRKKETGEIVLINRSDKYMNLSYLDMFSDFIPIIIKPLQSYKINIDTPIWVTNTHFKHGTMYLLRPGDSISLSFDELGAIKMISYSDNIERNNEIDIFRYINSKFEKSYYELIFESKTNDNPNTRFIKLEKLLKERYLKERQLLEEYLSVNPTSNEFSKCARVILALEYYSKQFIGLWNNKTFAKSVTYFNERFDSAYQFLRNDFLNNSCTPYLYKNIKYSYFIRNASNHLTQNPFLVTQYENSFSDSLYRLAKREVKNLNQLNQFLFLIVKEELLKYPGSSQKYIDSFFIDCNVDEYKEYIKGMLEINQIKSANNIGDVLLTFENKEVNFDSTINELKGNVLYIDTWASWCIPCRNEFPYTLNLRKKFSGKQLKFVYIAIDNNINLWKKAIKFENIEDYPFSFLLYNFESSFFKKSFKIGPIPRYILIDKTGKVYNADAPRPSDSALIPLLNKLLIK